MSTHNIRSYKLAKIFEKDLSTLIKHVDSAIILFAPYAKYSPINRILNVLQNEQLILKSHEQEAKHLIETKGKIQDE